jgi:hypothetical protein
VKFEKPEMSASPLSYGTKRNEISNDILSAVNGVISESDKSENTHVVNEMRAAARKLIRKPGD